MKSEAALLLTKAADHIETVGLNQDGDYYNREDREAGKAAYKSRCCTLGAMALVTSGVVGDIEFPPRAKREAKAALAGAINGTTPHGSIPIWNDESDPVEVLATLRATAERLEKQA